MMRTPKTILAGMVVGALAAAAAAQTTEPASLTVGERLGKALARLEYKIGNPLGQVTDDGLAVCLNKDQGLFITRDLPIHQVPTAEISELALIAAGPGGAKVRAELVGYDPETVISFVQAKPLGEGPKAGDICSQQVRFEPKANLQLGQQVMSVGILGPQLGNWPYLGAGTVGAVLRLPGEIVYVSGDLTVSSSPVFTAEGKVVGMVGIQLTTDYRMLIGGRWADVLLAGRQRTCYFVPVDDFAHLLVSPPSMTRTIGWIGVIRYLPLSPDDPRESLKGKTGAVVGEVMPDSPAGRAGLESKDVILELDHKPLERMANAGITVGNFERTLARMKPGQKVALTLMRRSQLTTVELAVEAMPARPLEAARYYDAKFGLGVRDIVPVERYAGRAKPLEDKGVIVIAALENSVVAKQDLRPDDLIIMINKKPTPTVAEFKVQFEAALKSPEGQVEFGTMRGTTPRSFVVKPIPQ